MSCFFDSNVLVYAMDRGAGARHALALGLIEQHLGAGSFVISTQVLQETYAVLTRKLGVAPAEAHTGLTALAREHVVGPMPPRSCVRWSSRLRIACRSGTR